MRNRRINRVFLPVLIAILLLVGALAALPEPRPMERVLVINSASIATDTNFSNFVWGLGDYADLYYRIDQGTVNTLSLELEVSPDGVNWYDHNDNATLLADNAADANGYVDSIPIHGHQFRIVANVTNTNTVTPNLKIVTR